MDLDLLVGSGGVLSHAPRRQQSAKMLIDSFMPEGITRLAVDSIFMMPQLGVLAHVDKKEFGEEARKAALEVFHKDCLIRLGTCITPVGRSKAADVVMTAELEMPDGEKIEKQLQRVWPEDTWIDLSTYLIYHGRQLCKARLPECDACFLHELCEKNIS